MSEYEGDSFENHSNKSDLAHSLKLSIDVMAIRGLATAANVFVSYQIQLTDMHSFTSSPPTHVSGSQETKL